MTVKLRISNTMLFIKILDPSTCLKYGSIYRKCKKSWRTRSLKIIFSTIRRPPIIRKIPMPHCWLAVLKYPYNNNRWSCSVRLPMRRGSPWVKYNSCTFVMPVMEFAPMSALYWTVYAGFSMPWNSVGLTLRSSMSPSMITTRKYKMGI